MTVRHTCLVLLFCFFSLFSLAQKNFKEAIVVLNNTDSLKGFIDYKEWYANPAAVLFTTEKSAAGTRYTVAEISYFEVTGLAVYQRHTIKASLSDDALSNTSGKDISTDTRTVFLKIMERGSPLTLFSYRDDLKQRLYVLDSNDSTPRELLNSVYMQNGQLIEEKQYRSALTTLVNQFKEGDNRTIAQISGVGYYANDISAIVRKINGKSTELMPANIVRHGGASFRIFAGAGISMGTISISGNSQFAVKTSSPFYSPLADIGADLMLKPEVGRIVLRLQAHITGYKTDAYVFKDFGQYTEEYFFTFKQQNISVAPQVLYNIYNKKNLKWFVGAGLAFNFSSYPTNQVYGIRKSSTNSETTDNNYIKYLKTPWVNFCFSTGVSVSRFELSAAYCPPGSLTQAASFGVKNSSLQLRLNFYLKK